MGELNWKHHTLIQALMSRGPLKESEFHSIFASIVGGNPGTHQHLFNDYLSKINKELAYLQFELRACQDQYDGMVYYGVVNNMADEQSKLGTKYSVPQIAFYKAVIEAIVQDATAKGSISTIDALNVSLENQTASQGIQSRVPPAFRNFSLSQKEKALNDLVQDRWLCTTADGSIGLGVRSFLDLRSWFRSNDVPSCDICNEAGVKADLCSNEGCSIRFHSYCLKKKFSQRKVERVCPGCGMEWGPQEVNGEEEAGAEIEEPVQSQAPPANPPMRKRLRSCRVEEKDAVGASSSQISQPAPESDKRKRIRRSERLR